MLATFSTSEYFIEMFNLGYIVAAAGVVADSAVLRARVSAAEMFFTSLWNL